MHAQPGIDTSVRRGSSSITMSEFHNPVGRQRDHRCHRAHAITPPINTNATGRDHLSKNFGMARPVSSAAVPLEMVGEGRMATHHHDRTIIARKVISIILEFFKQLQGESDTKVRMWQERTERRTPGGRRALLMAAVGSLASKRPGLEMTRSIDGPSSQIPGQFGPQRPDLRLVLVNRSAAPGRFQPSDHPGTTAV